MEESQGKSTYSCPENEKITGTNEKKLSLVVSEVCISISEMPMWKTGEMVKLNREKNEFSPCMCDKVVQHTQKRIIYVLAWETTFFNVGNTLI